MRGDHPEIEVRYRYRLRVELPITPGPGSRELEVHYITFPDEEGDPVLRLERTADALRRAFRDDEPVDVRLQVSADWQDVQAAPHGYAASAIAYHRWNEPDPTVCGACRRREPCPYRGDPAARP